MADYDWFGQPLSQRARDEESNQDWYGCQFRLTQDHFGLPLQSTTTTAGTTQPIQGSSEQDVKISQPSSALGAVLYCICIWLAVKVMLDWAAKRVY